MLGFFYNLVRYTLRVPYTMFNDPCWAVHAMFNDPCSAVYAMFNDPCSAVSAMFNDPCSAVYAISEYASATRVYLLGCLDLGRNDRPIRGRDNALRIRSATHYEAFIRGTECSGHQRH